MKKIVAIFITLILIFTSISPAYAKIIDELEDVRHDSDLSISPSLDITEHTPFDFEDIDEVNDEDQGILDLIMDAITGLLSIVTSAIAAIIGPIIAKSLPTIEGAIWNQDPTFQLTFFNGTSDPIHLLGDSFRGFIGSVYNGLRYLVATVYIVILVYLGVRMLLSSVGRQKAHYKTLLQYWFMGLVLLFAFHWVMAFLIWISYQITNGFATLGARISFGSTVLEFAGKSYGDLPNAPITAKLFTYAAEAAAILSGTIIGLPLGLVALIAVLVVSLIIIFTYLKRLVTVGFLIILFPIVVLSYVFDKIGDRRAQTFSIWFKEFTVNVFIQPIHAFILVIIAYIISSPLATIPIIGFVISLLSLTLISTLEKQLKSLFQINSSMGAGNGGFMGTLAHAGMAAHTLQKLGTSAVNMKKEAQNFKEARGLKAAMINKAGNNAEQKYLKKNPGDLKGAEKARKEALEKAKERVEDSKQYKNKMKELTGHTSLDEAEKAYMRKRNWSGFGAAVAFGGSLAGGDGLFQMAGKVTAGAYTGATIGHTFNELQKIGKPLESPELDEAEKIASTDNWDKLSDKDKEKLSEVTGINKKLINEDSKDLVKSKLATRREATKYGLKYDDPLIEFLEDDADDVRTILGGKDPNDPKGGNINWADYKRCITKDGAYLMHKESGKMYHIPQLANPKADDSIHWQDGSDSAEFERSLNAEAKELADRIALKRGIMNESGTILPGKERQYDKILENEQKALIDNHLFEHNRVFDAIEKQGHTMLDLPSSPTFSNVESRISTIDDVYKWSNSEQLSLINQAVPSAKDMASISSFAVDNYSRAEFINALDSMHTNNPEFQAIIENTCRAHGTALYDVLDGTVDSTKMQNIAIDLQSSLQPEIDAKRIEVANNLDMKAQANDIITQMTQSGAISTANLSTVASSSGIDLANPDAIANFLNTSTLQQKQEFIQNFSTMQTAQQFATPYARAVSAAIANGDVPSGTGGISISSPSVDPSTIFTSTTAGTVSISPVNTTTGMSTVTFTDAYDPSKSFTFESDAYSGGADITSLRAANLTFDSSGNPVVEISDSELNYSFTPAPAGFSQNDEPFYDFTLSELQAGRTSSTEFTLVRNSDVCAIIDKNSGKVLAIKEGSPSTVSSLTQYDVSLDSSGELRISSGFNNIDTLSKYKISTFADKNSGLKDLANRLFGR